MQIKPERNQQCKRKQVQNNNNGKKLSPGQRQNCEQLTTRKIAKARQTIPRRQKADALLLLSRSFLFLACPPPPVALLAGRVSFGVAGSASLQLRAPPARRPRSRSSRRRRRAASRAATGGGRGSCCTTRLGWPQTQTPRLRRRSPRTRLGLKGRCRVGPAE